MAASSCPDRPGWFSTVSQLGESGQSDFYDRSMVFRSLEGPPGHNYNPVSAAVEMLHHGLLSEAESV